MKQAPTFLDFEASSLSLNSYPIEIAWSLDDCSIEDHLISPAGIESWTDWDTGAQSVHNIGRQQLVTDGKPPLFICNRLNKQLAGKAVYSDAPQFDGMWLSRLFEVCSGTKPEFSLRHVDDLLVEMICPDQAGRTFGLIKIAALKQEARKQKPRQHRASWDVEYLIQLWRLAAFEVRGR